MDRLEKQVKMWDSIFQGLGLDKPVPDVKYPKVEKESDLLRHPLYWEGQGKDTPRGQRKTERPKG